jgi:PAS domain S-box-containing protein
VVDTGVPRVTPEGTFAGYIGSGIDITERMLAEERLRASEERYRRIVEDQTELICRHRPNTTLTFVNEAYCRYFGRTREELIGTSFLLLIPDEARQAALEHLQSLCEHPRIEPYEHPVIGANGEIRWQQWVVRQILDDHGRILEANGAYLRVTGFNRAELEAGQVRWDVLTLPEEFHLVRRSFAELAAGKESSTPYEKVYRLRDGRRIPVLLSGALLAGYTDRGVAYAIDLTERKQAEAALQKAQGELAHAARVLTMGELSASLAHELTQPLTAILSNAQAAQRFLAAASPDLDEVRAILADIVADDRRAGEVIHRLHRLLKRGELDRSPLDLNEIIREVVRLIHSEVVIKNVTMILDLGADLPPVPGDRVQLQQVVLNLRINGVKAMSAVEDRSRELLIRSCRHEAGGPEAHVIEQNDEHVGCAFGRTQRLDGRELRIWILGIVGGQTHILPIRDGQGCSLVFISLIGHRKAPFFYSTPTLHISESGFHPLAAHQSGRGSV